MKRCMLSLAIVMMSLTVAARADHDQDLRDQARTIEHCGSNLSDAVDRCIYRAPAGYWDDRPDLEDEIGTLFEIQRLAASTATLATIASGAVDTARNAVPAAFGEVVGNFKTVNDRLATAAQNQCNWGIAGDVEADLGDLSDSIRQMTWTLRRAGLIQRPRRREAIVEQVEQILIEPPERIRIGETDFMESEPAQFIVDVPWQIAQIRVTNKGGYSRYIRLRSVAVVTRSGERIAHGMYVKIPASDSHTVTLEKPVQAQQVHVTIVHKTSGIVVDAVPVSHHY